MLVTIFGGDDVDGIELSLEWWITTELFDDWFPGDVLDVGESLCCWCDWCSGNSPVEFISIGDRMIGTGLAMGAGGGGGSIEIGDE